VTGAVVLSGCNKGNDAAMRALERRIESLEEARKTATSLTDFLRRKVVALEVDSPPKSASFTPSDPAYQRIVAESGPEFLVSLQDVTAYANGFKVKFNFGNPAAADFENVTVELRWGRAHPGADAKEEALTQWADSFKTGTQTITKRLRGGSWNPVELNLTPATPDQIEDIQITKISTKSVYLRSQ